MAKESKTEKKTSGSTTNPQTRSLVGAGLATETAMDNLLDAIVNDLNAESADYEKTRYLLSAIGKKLAKENIKIRAGLYRNKEAGKAGLFLGA